MKGNMIKGGYGIVYRVLQDGSVVVVKNLLNKSMNHIFRFHSYVFHGYLILIVSAHTNSMVNLFTRKIQGKIDIRCFFFGITQSSNSYHQPGKCASLVPYRV